MTVTKEKYIEKIKNKTFRKTYLGRSFYKYCQYYFREYYSFDTPDCLRRYYKALQEGKNVYFKGFRGSAKTTIAQMYVNYCIAYKTRRNIMWYSQTIDNAEENLLYIANSFIWDTDWGERFIKDFGNIYYPEFTTRGWQRKLKRVDKFVTENECYVRAMSLGTSPRGKNYTASDWKFRPDLIIFDDVDTIASTQSKKKIDKNFEFILNEVLGGATGATQLIFLGNTIYEDWLVPRFEEHIKGDQNRETIILPIYDDKGEIVRDRFVETDEEAEELNKDITDSNKKYTSLETERRRLGTISFSQNYLLQPYVLGQHIITRDMIQYDTDCINYKFDKIKIGVDPAVSEKEGTDRYAITVTGYLGDRKYVLQNIGLEGEEKNIKRSSQVVYNLYHRRNATRVAVETVAYQLVLKTIFKDLGLAVEEIKTTKDKTTRLLEKQILFEDKKIYFYPADTKELVEELLAFPNWEHDDRVDSFLFSITESNKSFFISSLW